jgi:hypothetical protein
VATRLTKRPPGALEALREPYLLQVRNLTSVLELQAALGRWLIIENPHRSAFWNQPAWVRIHEAARLRYITLDQCMFGSKYRKRTVLATNLPEWATAHLEKLCTHGRGAHPPLIGSGPDGIPLTRATAHYPTEFCAALALAVENGWKLARARIKPHSHPSPHLLWHSARLCNKDVAFWRQRIGGLDLDGTQLVPSAQIPDLETCTPESPFLSQDLRGRRVFAHLHEHNALAVMEKVIATPARGSAALLIVPAAPSTIRNKHWQHLLRSFKVLHRYHRGDPCIDNFQGRRRRRECLGEDHLVIWLAPRKSRRKTVHVQQLKREQNKLLTDRLAARRRVDATLEDLQQSSWGKLSRPIASDVYALWDAYPGKRDQLFDDLDHMKHFGITVDAQALAKAHVEHCPHCKPRGGLQVTCYGHRLVHSCCYGWRFPLHTEPPIQVLDNYKSLSTEEARPHVLAKMKALDAYGVFTRGTDTVPPQTSTVPLQAVIREKDRIAYNERQSVENDLAKLKVRVCLDMSRNLNDYAPDWKFRYSGIDEVVPMLTKGCYFAILDLEKFFLQLPTHRSRWRYQCVFDPATKRFRKYRRCPFGFKLTPAFASAVSSEICEILRHRGVEKCSVFVDDIIIIGDNKQACEAALQTALRTCRELGFPVAPGKVVHPTQRADYLGVEIDTVTGELRISTERQQQLLQKVQSALKAGRLHKKETQRLLGKLNWCASVMPGARAYMRRLWYYLATLPSRGRHRLTKGCTQDLEWWLDKLTNPTWRGSRYWPADDMLPILIMKSDASGHIGCGYHIGEQVRTHVWTPVQLANSIAWKELYPVLLACKEFGSQWQGKIIRTGIDNAGVVYMINSGGAATANCSHLLRQIADLEAQFDFTVIASWVPREFNVAADTASRDDASLAQVQLKEESGERSLQKALSPPSSRGSYLAHRSRTWSTQSSACWTVPSA